MGRHKILSPINTTRRAKMKPCSLFYCLVTT